MTVRGTDPRGRPVLWRQLAVGVVLFGAYLLVDMLPGTGAERHGRDVYALEHALFLDVEHTVNNWLAPRTVLATIANYEYAYGYLISVLALLIWAYVRRPAAFTRVRDSFVLVNVIGIVSFALYPTMPPRLLGDLGFIDTVRQHGTWGSWGSGMVDHANQHAAMPSLHVAWTLWVSVVLADLAVRRWVQVLCALHVAVTITVIIGTANHYALDAIAAIVLVVVAVPVANAWHDRRDRVARARGEVVPPSDAFFLHVELTGAPQHVGGLVIFEPADGPTVAEVRAVVAGELERMPRLRQRLVTSRWRRPRWVPAGELDLDWHVAEGSAGGTIAGLNRIVADLAELPLPRDRPLWRVVVAPDVGAGRSALAIVIHHSVADGIGTIMHTLYLMRPRVGLPIDGAHQPGPLRRAGATAVGLAQLAADGRPRHRLDAGSPDRAYATAAIDLTRFRGACVEFTARFTELLLALVGDAVATTHPELAERLGGSLRVSVPLMARVPGASAEGNSTAAAMIDVPIDGRPFADLLAVLRKRTGRLRVPTRPLASRFVMATGLRVLPEPSAQWFAKTVYGNRFFHAIATNLVGPTERLSIADVPLQQVYPILPLAPGAPLSLGAMSWNGVLGFGIATDPRLLDADGLAARIGSLAALSTEDHTVLDRTRTDPLT